MITSVCVSVCRLCVYASISPEPHKRSLPNFLCMLPMVVCRSSSGGVAKSQGKHAILGLLFPIDNALYSIVFETHIKTAEPIEIPFGLMTRVGCRYHVLNRGPDSRKEAAILGENVAAHYTVMGHSTVCCAKTAEPIGMPFWMKTRVGPLTIIRWGEDPRRGRILGGCPGHSNALAKKLHRTLRHRCKRDHSIANNVMQQKGSFITIGKRK